MLGERCKDGCSPLASTCHLPSGTIRRSKPLSGHALGGLHPCEELKYAKMILFPMVFLNHGKTPWRGMGFKEKIFKASKNKYLRHQLKKRIKHNIPFSCAGAVFWPFFAMFNSCGLWISRSFSPLPWSPGPLVLPPFGGSGALKHFEDNP